LVYYGFSGGVFAGMHLLQQRPPGIRVLGVISSDFTKCTKDELWCSAKEYTQMSEDLEKFIVDSKSIETSRVVHQS
jgi:hypothetical protein